MGFLGFLIYCAAVIPPLWMLMPRYGLSSYVALFAILPIGVVALLWVMAMRPAGGRGGTV